MAVWDIERFLQWYKYSILIGQMSSFDWLIPDQPIRVEFLEVLKSPLNKYQLFISLEQIILANEKRSLVVHWIPAMNLK